MAWKKAFVFVSAAMALIINVGVAAAQANLGQVKRGETLYQVRGCAGCHGVIGDASHRMVAPNLTGVTARRSEEWLHKWLKDTANMIQTDSTAMQLYKQYNAKMPQQKFTDEDIGALLAFIKSKGG